jgi:hypothetical protein
MLARGWLFAALRVTATAVPPYRRTVVPPGYWYWIYIGFGYTSNTCSGVIIGLSFL